MAFKTVNTDAAALKDGGDGKHISKSGIYPVTIVGAFLSEGKNGSVSVDLCLNHLEKVQVLYGNLRVFNNDGSENEIGMKILNKLAILANIEGEIADPVDGELPIGKGSAMKDVSVLEDFTDLECFVQVQEEYSVYNGNIQEKKVIRGFWGADEASAEEHVKGENIGKNIAHTRENYADNVTYDGVTADEVSAWIKADRPKGTAGKSGGASTATKPSFNKPKSGFGKK